MKMNRGGIMLGLLVKVTVFAVIVTTLGYFTLDYIVEYGIEIIGTCAAGSRIRVSSVNISPTTGKGVVNGITVQNPKGFSNDTTLAIESVSFQIDTGSLKKNPVIIDQIRIEGPDVLFEDFGSDKSNVAELVDNIDRFLNEWSERFKSDGRRKRFVIRKFAVNRGRIAIRSSKTGSKTKTIPLPALTLTNMGGQNGSSSSQLSKEVVSVFGRAIIETATGRGFESYLKILVKNRILDKANGLIQKIF